LRARNARDDPQRSQRYGAFRMSGAASRSFRVKASGSFNLRPQRGQSTQTSSTTGIRSRFIALRAIQRCAPPIGCNPAEIHIEFGLGEVHKQTPAQETSWSNHPPRHYLERSRSVARQSSAATFARLSRAPIKLHVHGSYASSGGYVSSLQSPVSSLQLKRAVAKPCDSKMLTHSTMH
jgi:hypothetical protein